MVVGSKSAWTVAEGTAVEAQEVEQFPIAGEQSVWVVVPSDTAEVEASGTAAPSGAEPWKVGSFLRLASFFV